MLITRALELKFAPQVAGLRKSKIVARRARSYSRWKILQAINKWFICSTSAPSLVRTFFYATTWRLLSPWLKNMSDQPTSETIVQPDPPDADAEIDVDVCVF